MHIEELGSIECSTEIIVNQKRSILLTKSNGNIAFGVEIAECNERVPLQFAWFAKIILSKLAFMGYPHNFT